MTVDYFVADFSQGAGVYAGLAEKLKSLEVGVLVNNVGVGYDHPAFFDEVPEKTLWDLVYVNMASATMITHAVIPGMVAR